MTVSSVIPQHQTELLPEQICLAEPVQIGSYLQAHPMLVPFLRDAYPIITNHFPQMQVHLEVIHDPEGGSGMLFGLIQATEPAGATRKHLDELDNDPEWIALYTPIRSFCIVSVEYV